MDARREDEWRIKMGSDSNCTPALKKIKRVGVFGTNEQMNRSEKYLS